MKNSVTESFYVKLILTISTINTLRNAGHCTRTFSRCFQQRNIKKMTIEIANKYLSLNFPMIQHHRTGNGRHGSITALNFVSGEINVHCVTLIESHFVTRANTRGNFHSTVEIETRDKNPVYLYVCVAGSERRRQKSICTVIFDENSNIQRQPCLVAGKKKKPIRYIHFQLPKYHLSEKNNFLPDNTTAHFSCDLSSGQ